VEDAQRICDSAPLAVSAELVLYRFKRNSESLIEFHSFSRAANRAELESPAGDAETLKQRGQHFKNFSIARGGLAARRGRPDDLGIDLIDLPISTFLGAFPANHGANAIQLV